jgi:hypothetical protein
MTGPPNWAGRTVVAIASGPSLLVEDCELVRASGHPVIVTNTTFRRCPWADVLFGFDNRWWKIYEHEVAETFKGRKICAAPKAKYGAESAYVNGLPWFGIYRNSGACAVSIAMASGAAKIVLLGFDCKWSRKGRRHWHADHPRQLENADSIVLWERLFAILAKRARRKGVIVLNASRETALTCFPRIELESAL